MCEYGDYSYEHISTRIQVSRAKHQCNSCLENWPAGTEMEVHVGKTEGDFGVARVCPVCWWGERQEDHTPLHLCGGWAWSDDDRVELDHGASYREAYNYLRWCLENHEWPTVTGLMAAVEQLRAADEAA